MQDMLEWIEPQETEVFKKATELLEKEKEQIMKAARVCNFEGMRQGSKTSEEIIKYGEEYYNETFDQNK
jgi:NADPH-dependent glutamate synthase beta subunit-like oxidoreductase